MEHRKESKKLAINKTKITKLTKKEASKLKGGNCSQDIGGVSLGRDCTAM